MNKKEYKGINYEFDRGGYIIYFPNNEKHSFTAYAGNKVFNMEYLEAEKIMERKAKYQINKWLKENETNTN